MKETHVFAIVALAILLAGLMTGIVIGSEYQKTKAITEVILKVDSISDTERFTQYHYMSLEGRNGVAMGTNNRFVRENGIIVYDISIVKDIPANV